MEEVRATLREASRLLVAAHRRLETAADRYVVGVVGLTNVGKSTLLNALFGVELAPHRNGPCTAAPIEFVHGEEHRVTAYFHTSLTRPSWPCTDVEAVHQRLASLADDSGDSASRELRKVLVEAHLAPGQRLGHCRYARFCVAQVGDAAGSHEDALRHT